MFDDPGGENENRYQSDVSGLHVSFGEGRVMHDKALRWPTLGISVGGECLDFMLTSETDKDEDMDWAAFDLYSVLSEQQAAPASRCEGYLSTEHFCCASSCLCRRIDFCQDWGAAAIWSHRSRLQVLVKG